MSGRKKDWLLQECISAWSTCLGNFNEPTSSLKTVASALFYVQSLTLGKWPRGTGNEILSDVDYSEFQSSEKSCTILKVSPDEIWPRIFLHSAVIEHQWDMGLEQQD